MPQVGPFLSGFFAGATGSGAAMGGAVAVGTGASSVGAAALGVAIGSNAFVQLALSIGLSMMLSKVMTPEMDPIGSALDITYDSLPASRFIYGTTKVAGAYVYAETSDIYGYDSGFYIKRDDSENYLLHTVVELANHPIKSIDEIEMDSEVLDLGQPTWFSANRVWLPDPFLEKDSNGVLRWTEMDPNGTYYSKLCFKLYPEGAAIVDADLIASQNYITAEARELRYMEHTSDLFVYPSTTLNLTKDKFRVGFGASRNVPQFKVTDSSTNIERYVQWTDITAVGKVNRFEFDVYIPTDNDLVTAVRLEYADGTLIHQHTPTGSDVGKWVTITTSNIDATSGSVRLYLVLSDGTKLYGACNGDYVLVEYINLYQRDANRVLNNNFLGNNRAYYYARYRYDVERYSGIPSPLVTVTGKNDIYDPRKTGGSATFTDGSTIIDITDHGLETGDIIKFQVQEGEVPFPFMPETNYYVTVWNSFQISVSETRNGAHIVAQDNNETAVAKVHVGGYSNNPALCIADYITTPRYRGGMGESWDEIDIDVLIASANICDELIDVYDGGDPQKRYTLNGTFTTDSEPHAILRDMLITMAGYMDRINGKWHIVAGTYSAPEITLTESELRDRPTVTVNKSEKDIFNSVRPVLRADINEYQPSTVDSVEALNQIAVTANRITHSLSANGHGLVDDDRVMFRVWDGSQIDNTLLPNGIVENVYYYVVNATTNTFQLSNSSGGTPIILLDAGSPTLIAFHDLYLSRDGERKSIEIQYPFVTQATQARRLAIIGLRQSRMETTATIPCKLGTPYAPVFDLKIGDSFRWIDQQKLYYEKVGSPVSITADFTGLTPNPFTDNTPVIFDSLGSQSTGIQTDKVYYVVDADDYYFNVAEYRGGPAVFEAAGEPDTGYTVTQVQGKLFRVNAWKMVIQDGVLGVDIDATETSENLYEWTADHEVAPSPTAGISLFNTSNIRSLKSFNLETGTDQLYIRTDGTVQPRIKATWDISNNAFVRQGGHIILDYRINPSLLTTVDPTTDVLSTVPDHGLFNEDRILIHTEGTRPAGIESQLYYALVISDHEYQLSETPSGSAINITDVGSGNHWTDPVDRWDDTFTLAGDSSQTYITDVNEGLHYDVRIAQKTSMGAISPYSYRSIECLGKSVPPNDVTELDGYFVTTSFESFLSWENPTDLDLDKIKLYRQSSEGLLTFIAELPKSTNNYRDQVVVAANDTYTYTVVTVDTSNLNSTGATVNVSVPGYEEDDVPSFAVTSSTEFPYQVNISWDENSSFATWLTYRVIQTSSGYEGPWKWVNYSAGAVVEENIPVNGTVSVQAYRVFAVQNILYSAESSQNVTVYDYPVPNNVSGLTCTFNTTTFQSELAWTNPTNLDFDSVMLYRKPSGGSYVKIAILSDNETTYNDEVVTTNTTTYTYKVVSVSRYNKESDGATVNVSVNGFSTLPIPSFELSATAPNEYMLIWDASQVGTWLVYRLRKAPTFETPSYVGPWKWQAYGSGEITEELIPVFGDVAVDAYRVFAVQDVQYSALTTLSATTFSWPAIPDFAVVYQEGVSVASWGDIPSGYSPDYLEISHDGGEGVWDRRLRITDVFKNDENVTSIIGPVQAGETINWRMFYQYKGLMSEYSLSSFST